MTVPTEIEAVTFRIDPNPCYSKNSMYTRGLIGIAVNEAHCISHRQVAWNRVHWKSDYDEWSRLLFEKSDCEIATSVNVKLVWWRHWTVLTVNEFRCLFREGPWERAEKQLGVQAGWENMRGKIEKHELIGILASESLLLRSHTDKVCSFSWIVLNENEVCSSWASSDTGKKRNNKGSVEMCKDKL